MKNLIKNNPITCILMIGVLFLMMFPVGIYFAVMQAAGKL